MAELLDKCPHCKKMVGFLWHWSKSMEKGDGWQECKGCKKRI